jgi:hypothetical protein
MCGTRSPIAAIAIFVACAAVFAAVYPQAPLYYSNQNQYFLHGLARAGEGLLHEDWLASTGDPTPLFSGIVALTVRFLHPAVFHVCYAVLFGIYALSLLGLFGAVAGPEIGKRRWPIFAALLLGVHAGIVRWASYRLFGDDYPWFLQAGVAGQYLLGAMFQPSTLGVLLVAAVCLFVLDRPIAAIVCACLAATVHSTYLLPAAMLTCGFMLALVSEGHGRAAFKLGGLALVLVLPITLYVLLRFGPTSAEEFAQAQEILVHVRIPHHALPRLWLDEVAGLQFAWIALAIGLARPTRLRTVLATALLLSVVLTLAQAATENNTLALLFPWRVTAVLVPIATGVILSRVVAALPASLMDGTPAKISAAAVIVGLAAAGVWISATGQGFRSDDDELRVMDHVRRTAVSGDVYFLPVRVPKLAATTRGSLSSDYKPLPDKQKDVRVIPVNLQRFRLHAEAPIWVDFKSIPYLDVEVLEWHTRLLFAEAMLERLKTGVSGDALTELRARRITHLVLPRDMDLEHEQLEKTYEDPRYAVYRLRPQRGEGEP